MSGSSANRYRSFFWPGLLILIGILALLVNSGVLTQDRILALFDLWPLILIVIGLELIARRAVQGRSGEIAAVLIVLVALVGAIAYVAAAPGVGGPTETLDASGSAGNLTQASVEIEVGAANITMSGSSSLGGDLYRAHIEYSGRKPDISLDTETGDLRISQSGTSFTFFQSRRLVMNLQLNSSVTWKISNTSGAATDTLNLSALQVRSIQVNTGASREDITVGAPSGIVPISINGGALTVTVHRPSGVAASVVVSGGAVSLEADGKQTHAIGTATYDSPGYSGATDGYRIEVNGGACTVTLDSNLPD